jgi:hypothetical protein
VLEAEYTASGRLAKLVLVRLYTARGLQLLLVARNCAEPSERFCKHDNILDKNFDLFDDDSDCHTVRHVSFLSLISAYSFRGRRLATLELNHHHIQHVSAWTLWYQPHHGRFRWNMAVSARYLFDILYETLIRPFVVAMKRPSFSKLHLGEGEILHGS